MKRLSSSVLSSGFLVAAVTLAVGVAALAPASAQPARPVVPAAVGGAPVVGTRAPGRRVTLAEAVARVLAVGHEIKLTEAGIEASEARVSGARAQRLPVLRAEANVLYWDKPLDIALVPPSSMMGMTGTTGMETASPALRVRDQVTSQVTISLAQPLSGLLVLHKLVALERAGVGAARHERARAELDAASQTTEAYLRLLQAKALQQIADQSVTQVEAQLERARVLERAGALGAVDVLRLTSARDTARQGQLRARTGAVVAEGALATLLQLPRPLEVLDDLPNPPPRFQFDQDAVARSSQDRPEAKTAVQRLEQARGGSSVAKAALLPSVLAVATYQNTQGQATFQPKNAWFVGLTLSWDVWDWGKNWNGVKEANAKVRQAQEGLAGLRSQLHFDAERKMLEAGSAYESIAVARSAMQAAEEAYRIQSVRYAEGAATTTDVIDAETDVSRARSGYTQARYEYFLAQAAVARAVGRLPVAQLSTWRGNDAKNP